MPGLGKTLLFVGLAVAATGLIIWLSGNKLNWFGRLPGDVRVEREGFRLYAPFMTMLLISLALSAVIWVINRFFR